MTLESGSAVCNGNVVRTSFAAMVILRRLNQKPVDCPRLIPASSRLSSTRISGTMASAKGSSGMTATPITEHIGGGVPSQGPPRQQNVARLDRLQSQQRLPQGALAVARNPGNAQYLPVSDGETHAVEAGISGATGADFPELKRCFPGGALGAAGGGFNRRVRSHHCRHEAPRVELPAGRCRHDAAPAQHRDAVRHRQRLPHLVGDEQDRVPVVAQGREHPEQPVRLVGRQHTGGLVENEQAGVGQQQLDELDALSFT